MTLVIGDLPAPGGVAAGERDDGGDRVVGEREAGEPRLAVAGKVGDGGGHEGADVGMIARRGAGAALPAGSLECEEVVEPGRDRRRLAGDGGADEAIVAEAAQLAAQLLELLVAERLL